MYSISFLSLFIIGEILSHTVVVVVHIRSLSFIIWFSLNEPTASSQTDHTYTFGVQHFVSLKAPVRLFFPLHSFVFRPCIFIYIYSVSFLIIFSLFYTSSSLFFFRCCYVILRFTIAVRVITTFPSSFVFPFRFLLLRPVCWLSFPRKNDSSPVSLLLLRALSHRRRAAVAERGQSINWAPTF